MGLFDSLFGRKGKPGQVVDTTPAQFAALRDPLADALRGLISSGGGPSFPGAQTAALTPQEQTLLGSVFGQVSTTPAGTQAAQTALADTARGNFLSPESNPFLRATIDAATRPVIEAFNEITLPRLRGDFSRAGQFVQGNAATSGGAPSGSSPFDLAVARAGSGVLNAIGDVSANIAGANFQNERNRQVSAAAALPGIDAQLLDSTIKGLQAVALPRLVEQLGIDRGIEEFNRRVLVLLEALGRAGQLSTGQAVAVPGTAGTSGALGPLLSGAGDLLSGIGAFRAVSPAGG